MNKLKRSDHQLMPMTSNLSKVLVASLSPVIMQNWSVGVACTELPVSHSHPSPSIWHQVLHHADIVLKVHALSAPICCLSVTLDGKPTREWGR